MAKYNLVYDEYRSSDFDNNTDLNPQREIITGLGNDREIITGLGNDREIITGLGNDRGGITGLGKDRGGITGLGKDRGGITGLGNDFEFLVAEQEILSKIKEKILQIQETPLQPLKDVKIERFIENVKEDLPKEISSALSNSDMTFNNTSLGELEESFKNALALAIAADDTTALEELKKGGSNFSLCVISSLEKLLEDDDEIRKAESEGDEEKLKDLKKNPNKKKLSSIEREKINKQLKEHKKKVGNLIKGKKNDKYKLCLYQDIGLLQFLLIVLMVLQFINQTISNILSIAVPLSEFSALICGCWASPANVGEIIQKVLQIAVSNVLKGLIGLVDSLLRELFKKCPQPMAIDLLKKLDEILGIMAGKVEKAVDVLTVTTNVPKKLVEKKKELFDKFKKILEKEITQIKNGTLLRELGMDETGVKLITNILENALESGSIPDVQSVDPSLIPDKVKQVIQSKFNAIEDMMGEIDKEIESVKNIKQFDKEDDMALELLSGVQKRG